jgi:hypothetical protein
MAETRRARRPNKAFLGRIKVLAVILSFVAFVGSLAGVAIANPATANRQVATIQPVEIGQVSGIQGQSSGEMRVMPSRPQLPRVRPMTRTRGS